MSLLLVLITLAGSLAFGAAAGEAQVQSISSGHQTIGIASPNGPNTDIDVRVPLNLVEPAKTPTLHPGAPSTTPNGIISGTSISGALAGVHGLSINGVGVAARTYASAPIVGEFPSIESAAPGLLGESYGKNGGIGIKGVAPIGIGVLGEGSDTGIKGTSQKGSGVFGTSGAGAGVAGYSFSGTAAANAGVVGRAEQGYGVSGEGADIGVYGHNTKVTKNAAYLGSQCCAGDFYGNVAVHGTLTKSAGSMKIDHPLYPTKKYLYHSFVESPDMMNLYNGIATLGPDGTALVQLPAWFEALNQEYRYQLTPIGGPAPSLHIARKIVDNQFIIAGGGPGMEVSWQVTGIRQDRYASAYRIPIEEDKSPTEVGMYLHPELYDSSPERSVQFARYPGAAQDSGVIAKVLRGGRALKTQPAQ